MYLSLDRSFETPIAKGIAIIAITKLTNKSKLYQLELKGMIVITFNHVGNSQTINDWLQTYNYPTTPLNILFTKRHPKGLVLPTDLNQINWENATATFN